MGLGHAEDPTCRLQNQRLPCILEGVTDSSATLESPKVGWLVVGDWPTDFPSPDHCFHSACDQNHQPHFEGVRIAEISGPYMITQPASM